MVRPYEPGDVRKTTESSSAVVRETRSDSRDDKTASPSRTTHENAKRSEDADALWALKRGFETGLGEGTGSDEKREQYDAKLTEDYRDRWLDWVARCVNEEAGCVQVAERDGDLVGYAFVLPESLALVWDAAVLNEIFVEPAHRGEGVADDLMDEALAVARDQDLPLDRMVLDVDRENERARSFYERYGFEHWGEMVARDI